MCLLLIFWVPGAVLEQPVSLLPRFEIINSLDLVSFTIALWTLWTVFSLSLGGALQRAFRLIAIGALAFALSHILDALVQELQLLSAETATFCHQGCVLVSTLFFVAGVSGLVETLPTLSAGRRRVSSPVLWPLAGGLVFTVAALSFIVYGFNLEAASIAFIGLNICLIFLVGLACLLLWRSRISGAFGRALWLAFLGLLIFSLAHPVQAWQLFQPPASPAINAIIHRLVVVPAFLLFALSVVSPARALSRALMRESIASLQGRANQDNQAPAPQAGRPGSDLSPGAWAAATRQQTQRSGR